MKIYNNHNISNINYKSSYSSVDRVLAKNKILTANNNREAAEIFDSFVKNELNRRQFSQLSIISKLLSGTAITAMLLSISATIFTGNPLFALLAGGFGYFTHKTNKNIISSMAELSEIPLTIEGKNQQKIQEFSKEIARGDYDIEYYKNSPYWEDHYKLHKEDTQNTLLNLLEHYSNTPNSDKLKITNYIMNNYDEYYWNELIPYCIRYSSPRSCQNENQSCSYENFMKLKEMSEAVYDLWHNTSAYYGYNDLTKHNDRVYNDFHICFPNQHFNDYLKNNWRRDEKGIITDEEVKNFKDFAHNEGYYQALWVLWKCKNKDGYIAWNAAHDFMKTAVTIVNTLDSNYKELDEQMKELMTNNILVGIVENCYDENGILNENRLAELYKKIKNEIDNFGMENSRTLKQVIGSYTRTKLRMFDDDIESVEEAINNPNRLYSEICHNNSIIEYLKDADCTPSEIFALLYKLTTTEDGKSRIIEEFSSNPRVGQDIKDLLLKKLGGDKKAEKYFNTWYFDEKNGYRKVYKDYYKHELFEKAKDLMTIVKQSPNIGTWAFKQKADELGVELTLGSIPEDFGSVEDFKSIIRELKHINKKNHTKTPSYITVNQKKYYVSKINEGHSPKIKYIIKPEGNNAKTYVLKFSPYNVPGNTDRSRKFNDSFMLRGDSPYLVALLDFYLKENDCPNAPDIKYFDYNEKAILYEMTIGQNLELNDMDFYNAYLLNNSEKLKDVKDLGVLINDINYKNILETKDGRLVIVDIGHANFVSPFRPMVQGINISLGNLCGRELQT